MTEKESILTKIKKLQSLTVDRGATPEEAATAAAKAQALLFEHNLAQADVETLGPDAKPDPYGKVEHAHTDANRNNINWRRTLLHIIAENNFCSTVYTPNTTKQTVIGKKSNVETVLYLNECIARQIEEMATQAAKTQLTDKASYKISFARGAVATISNRLYQQRKESEMKATSYDAGPQGYTQDQQQRNALVIRNSALELQATVKKFYPRLSSGRSSAIRNHEAYSAGKAAGHNISMNRGVGGRGQGRIS